MKGTLLNCATVAAGSALGLAVGAFLPGDLQGLILGLLGLVTIAVGVGMFGRSKEFVVVVAALAIGAALGYALGLAPRLDALGETLKAATKGSGRFTEGFVTASVLFCVGPMTILGALEDGLTGKSDLLRLKSTLDGIASIFLAGTLGVGVALSIVTILLVQGGLSLAARRLSWLRDDEAMVAEISGVGGPLLIGVGLGLLDIKRLPLADALPALVLAPLFVAAGRIFKGKKGRIRHAI